MIFWEIALVAIATLGLALYIGVRLSSEAGKKAVALLEGAEEKYREAASTRFTLLEAKGDIPDEAEIERMVESLFVIVKPDIDGLLAHINAVEYSGVRVRFPARYFAGAASLAESLMKWRHKNAKALLGMGDEQKMRDTVKDAIRSDLTARALNLKMKEL